MYTPVLLLILDGYGYAPASGKNAISQADTPNINKLYNQPGVSVIKCCGRDVGLPDGYMGNSEVGHLNIGSGRVVYQDMARIDVAVENKELHTNQTLLNLLKQIKAKGGKLHLLGLLSDAGVHSHVAHLEVLTDIAKAHGVKVRIHAFMDGRDTSPHSGVDFVKRIMDYTAANQSGRLASLCGRYYSMDRDKRWDRVKLAWDMLVHGQGKLTQDPIQELQAAYADGETDEFIKPRLIAALGQEQDCTVNDGDGILFFNFRSDRARELASIFELAEFADFDRGTCPKLSGLASMVSYDEDLHIPVLFAKDNLLQTLGEVASSHHIKQLRIAETEKYAHVTYFFNGGREEPFALEDRILVNSPKDIATYDLKPSMSVYEVTDKLLEAWNSGQYQFLVCNLANPDMVGHTGNMQAVMQALKAVDECVGKIAAAVFAKDGVLLLTADHGNADEMLDASGNPSTAHSHNPVRLGVFRQEKAVKLEAEGRLADIAPTILSVWNIEKPKLMSGQSLIVK